MSLKSIQYNTVFNLTTDIRRYTYEIEQYIKGELTSYQVIPAPSIPDEIEPEVPRYIIHGNIENNIIKFEISQLRISFILENTNNKYLEKSNFDNLMILIKRIKIKLHDIIPNFSVLYEGIVVVNENIKNTRSEIELIPNFLENTDELRLKDTIIKNNKYFVTTEKVVIRVFNSESRITALSKNKPSSLLGYLEVNLREINNRYSYNESTDDSDNSLVIEEIKTELLEGVSYE